MVTRSKPVICKPADIHLLGSTNEDADNPASNAFRYDSMGLIYRATDGSGQMQGRFGPGVLTLTEIDLFAVLMSNADDNATIRLRMSQSLGSLLTSPNYDSGTVTVRSPLPAVDRADGLSHLHINLPTGQSYRYFHIDFAGFPDPTEVGGIVLGKRIEPEHFYDPEYEFGQQDFGSAEITKWGALHDEGGAMGRSLQFTIGWTDEVEYEEQWRPLQDVVGQRVPIYCCFDPGDHEYRQARTYFGILGRPLIARGVRKPKTFQQELQITSFI